MHCAMNRSYGGWVSSFAKFQGKPFAVVCFKSSWSSGKHSVCREFCSN